MPMKKISIILTALVALVSCHTTETVSIMPYPNDITVSEGHFVAAGASVFADSQIDQQSIDLITKFAEHLSFTAGKQSKVEIAQSGEGIIFRYYPDMPSEAYSLEVTSECAVVKASGLRGFNYAIQTMKQLLPVEIYGNETAKGAKWTMPCVVINDAPRFSYRGLHLDESRHFFGMDQVKKYIDIMEVHKLNTLHWHLTDDQGWRIEIKKYPELTEIGSVRSGTCIKGDGSTSDGIPYGEGMWYSQGQIAEIIDYAAAKGIDIVPEIDLPGHMLAALAAYPELGCKDKDYQVWSSWGVSKDVLCAGNDKVYAFLKDVLAEVCELFPYEYVHIGGDECPKDSWKVCPKCQAKIRQLGIKGDKEYSAEHYLQSYVMSQMEEFLAQKGKKVIGWDEILEGNISESATVMSWRGEVGGIKAAGLGHDVIMTPDTYYYLDYYQSFDVDNEPFGIGGYLPVERCYSYEPYPATMSEADRKHIIGVQANLWTEYISTNEHLEYMLLPRLAALSEVQWCNADRKDWDRFLEASDDICRIYGAMGYSYATHLFGVNGDVEYKADGKSAVITLYTQGDMPIYYTLDGTEPTRKSARYTGPVEISHTCHFQAKVMRDDFPTRPFSYHVTFHKAVGCPITLETKSAKGINLVDALRGPGIRKRKEWIIFTATPMTAVIDMDGCGPYTSVTASTMILKPKLLFNPTYLSVSVSEDGSAFTEIAREEYPAEGQFEPNGLKEYKVTFPETSARYLKVSLGCQADAPKWHHYNDRKGSVAVDEIIVE